MTETQLPLGTSNLWCGGLNKRRVFMAEFQAYMQSIKQTSMQTSRSTADEPPSASTASTIRSPEYSLILRDLDRGLCLHVLYGDIRQLNVNNPPTNTTHDMCGVLDA